MTDEKLTLQYVPVSSVRIWGENPKNHDIGSIIQSIQLNGFRDPPAWDNVLSGIIEGNGRTECLQKMEIEGYEIPRGIMLDKDGNWLMPVLFGIDSESVQQAQRYAIDHNNLTMLGGDFTAYDMSRMWDNKGYIALLSSLESHGEAPISLDLDDMRSIINGIDDIFDLGLENVDMPKESNNSAGNKVSDDTVVKVYIGNDIIIDDVTNAIQELLGEHPEWEAHLLG